MSRSKAVLLTACFLALMMVMDRLVAFVETRIPPFAEGQCLAVADQGAVNVKVLRNHILAGYSDVEVSISAASEKAKVFFGELRSTPIEKVKCP